MASPHQKSIAFRVALRMDAGTPAAGPVTKKSLASYCTTRHNTAMIPFRVEFRPGTSLYEQVVYAAKKALVSRLLRPGDAFPSVRMLSVELKINPNTAHKVVTTLLNEGLLEVMPGIGTVVARSPGS